MENVIIQLCLVTLTLTLVSAAQESFPFMKYAGAQTRRTEGVEVHTDVEDHMACARKCLLDGHQTEFSFNAGVCNCHLDSFFFKVVGDLSAPTSIYNDVYYRTAKSRDFNDVRYILSEEKLTWAAAQTYCRDEIVGDYELMKDDSTDVHDWLTMQLKDDTDDDIWTAGSDVDVEDTWEWKVNTDEALGIDEWDVTPTTDAEVNCMYIKAKDDSTVKWFPAACTASKFFICSGPVPV